MNVSIGQRWTSFVEGAVRSGRYGSASEVVGEALRLLEEREAKLQGLRQTLNASINGGGRFSDNEVAAAIEAKARELTSDGR